MSSRWVLVEIEDLPAYRQVGLFCAFQQYPGVVRVTDLQAITRETLDRWPTRGARASEEASWSQGELSRGLPRPRSTARTSVG